MDVWSCPKVLFKNTDTTLSTRDRHSEDGPTEKHRLQLHRRSRDVETRHKPHKHTGATETIWSRVKSNLHTERDANHRKPGPFVIARNALQSSSLKRWVFHPQTTERIDRSKVLAMSALKCGQLNNTVGCVATSKNW